MQYAFSFWLSIGKVGWQVLLDFDLPNETLGDGISK
jgi:hypothetical protein